MRFDLDRCEASSGVGFDHDAVAAFQVDSGGEVGRDVSDRLQAYADNHRPIFGLLEKIAAFTHDLVAPHRRAGGHPETFGLQQRVGHRVHRGGRLQG